MEDRSDRGRLRSSCSCPEQTQPTVLAKAMEEAVWLLVAAMPMLLRGTEWGKRTQKEQ